MTGARHFIGFTLAGKNSVAPVNLTAPISSTSENVHRVIRIVRIVDTVWVHRV